jgi:hypothetical protein
MDVFKSRFSAFFAFLQELFPDGRYRFYSTAHASKQTKERRNPSNERTNERKKRFEMQFFGKEAFSLFSLLLLSRQRA